MISKKGLAILLSKLQGFPSPDVHLEQYATDSEIAAEALWQAHMHGLVEGKRVTDLGCGTGILGIGCLLLGAEHVDFVDNDAKALLVLGENLGEAEISESGYTIWHQDAQSFAQPADLVVQNPPFGTRRQHADLVFLQKASMLAPALLTFHKTSTAAFIEKQLAQEGYTILWTQAFRFPLKQSMAQHVKKKVLVDVKSWLARKPS